MTFSRFTNRMRPIIVLEQDSYECATFKGGPAKPAVKDIEDSKQSRGSRARATFNALLQPCSSPKLLASPKEGKHELLFRRIVQIERPLRHAGTGDNGVYPHSANAAARKKLISRRVDAVACGHRLKRLGLSRTRHEHIINGRPVCLPTVRALWISVDIDHHHVSRAVPRAPAPRPTSIHGLCSNWSTPLMCGDFRDVQSHCICNENGRLRDCGCAAQRVLELDPKSSLGGGVDVSTSDRCYSHEVPANSRLAPKSAGPRAAACPCASGKLPASKFAGR